jgi:hypothetical protein
MLVLTMICVGSPRSPQDYSKFCSARDWSGIVRSRVELPRYPAHIAIHKAGGSLKSPSNRRRDSDVKRDYRNVYNRPLLYEVSAIGNSAAGQDHWPLIPAFPSLPSLPSFISLISQIHCLHSLLREWMFLQGRYLDTWLYHDIRIVSLHWCLSLRGVVKR